MHNSSTIAIGKRAKSNVYITLCSDDAGFCVGALVVDDWKKWTKNFYFQERFCEQSNLVNW